MEKCTARLDVRIEPALREAIERLAEAKDRSVAWIVRDALKRYVQTEHAG